MTPLDEHWTTIRQDAEFEARSGKIVKAFGDALVEWIAAQPYPAKDDEFIRALICRAKQITGPRPA